MIQHALTDDTFQKGLKKYLISREFDSATDRDLYDALKEAVGEEGTPIAEDATLSEILDSWTLQFGFPILNVERDYMNKSAVLSQERFVYEPTIESRNQFFWIPYNYVSRNAPNFENTQPDNWLANISNYIIELDVEHIDWVIFNKQQTGYYRVNYDERNWNMIIDELKNGDLLKIHPINRAQLIDDSFNLARAGTIDYSIPFSLSVYLKKELSYPPWYAADINFRYLHKLFKGSAQYDTFRLFLLELVEKLYSGMGIDNKPDDTMLQKYSRRLAVNWACTLKHPECLAWTKTEFEGLLVDGQRLDPDLKEYVICYGVSATSWRNIWEMLIESRDQSDRSTLIDALGCLEDKDALNEIMDTTISTDEAINYRRPERNQLFTSILTRSTNGFEVTTEFLRLHYVEVQSMYNGNKTLQSFVMSIANQVTDQNQADLVSFFNDFVQIVEFFFSSQCCSFNYFV